MRKGLNRLFIAGMLLCLVFALAGCRKKEEKKQEPEVKTEESKETEASPDLKTVVLTVGDTEVTYQEAMLYILRTRSKYETTLTDAVWSYKVEQDNTFEDIAKQAVIDELCMLKILRQKAEEMQIVLDSDETDEVREYAASTISQFTSKDKSKYGISTELIETYASDNYLAEKVYEVATNEVDTNVSDEEAKQIKVQYLFVKDKKKADKYWKQAKEAEDFKTFAEKYTQADDIETVFGKGDMETAFEEAAFKLKTGKLSKVIKGEEGYYIIYCISDFDEDATVSHKEELIKDRQMEAFQTKYQEWLQDYNVKINSKSWDKISFVSEP